MKTVFPVGLFEMMIVL